MLLRVETNDTLRTSLAGFIESWINSTVSLVMSASSFGHRDFIILTQVYSLKGIIALLFSEVAPASELDQFAYNALVSAVVLSVVLQYLIGYVDKGGTKTYNSGSLEFRATFVSLLLFRGAYVWIKFRDVPPNRAVYRRFRKDENGGFHHYGKYEPRFKPPREKDAVTGGVRKFEYLPLGGYDTHREAEVACQIAGYYYGKDDGKVKLEDGSFFDIPRMSEQERSLCGEQKRNFVRGKVKEVHKVFKEDVARRSRSSDGLGASPGDHIPHCADQTDVNCEADFLHILNELPEPDSEVDLNVDEVPDCSQQENIGVPTMQENLNEQLNLEDPELPRQFEFLTMMLRQAANTISSHLVASTEGNLELPQKYEYLMTVLQEVVKALQYCRVTSTKV